MWVEIQSATETFLFQQSNKYNPSLRKANMHMTQVGGPGSGNEAT